MNTWQTCLLILELAAVVFGLDWMRRDVKYSRRRAEYRLRVKRRSEDTARDLPAVQPQDAVAALLHARAKDQLVVENVAALSNLIADDHSRKAPEPLRLVK